ncbi:hypothetical protein OAV13_00570 [bacterium]|nr:hypothetical protein [bacterium]
MTLHTGLPNNKNKIFGGAYSIQDPITCNYKNVLLKNYRESDIDFETTKLDYFDQFKYFLGQPHNLIGLDLYTHSCFTQGTTESFLHFYLRYRDKRLRLAKGEYFFHQMTKNMYYQSNFAWLDEEELASGDVLVLSVPFADSCELYPKLDEILYICDVKRIPVMLDLAYINLAIDFTVDLTHPCIEYVVSSLSKVFPLENHRVGIRLQKNFFEDPLYVINEQDYNYINMCSVYLGLKMMQQFEPTYIYKKYLDSQFDMCKKLGLKKSSCVYFGIDENNVYPEYSRGADTNRLCFSRVWDGRMTFDM